MSGAILDNIKYNGWVPYRFEGAPCTYKRMTSTAKTKEVQDENTSEDQALL